MATLHRLTIIVATLVAAAGACGCGDRTARFVTSGDRYVKQGDFKAAAIEYRNAIKRSPSSVDAHRRLAEVASRLQDAPTVAAELLKIAELAPGDATAQVRAGQVHLLAGRTAEAEAAFRRAISIDQDVAAYSGLATVYMAANRLDEAERYWKIVTTHPNGDPFALADYYFRLDRFAEAERELRALIAAPSAELRDAARLRLASVQYAAGRRRDAEQSIDTVVEHDQHALAAWLLRGRLRLHEQHLAQATAAYAGALTIDTHNLEALTQLTAIDLKANRPSAAVDRLQTSLADSPDNVPLLVLTGRTYMAVGDAAKAEQTLRHAIEIAPDALDAYGLLSELYVREQRLDDARVQFEKMVARGYNTTAARTAIGLIHEAQGRLTEARAEYEAAARDNRGGIAANNLAWLDLTEGRLDDALRYALAAKQALPGLPQINDTLGWVYYRRNQPHDAMPLLAESVAAAPQNALYRFHLGMAYRQLGLTVQAEQELQRSLRLSKQFAGRAEAELTLAEIRSAPSARQ